MYNVYFFRAHLRRMDKTIESETYDAYDDKTADANTGGVTVTSFISALLALILPLFV